MFEVLIHGHTLDHTDQNFHKQGTNEILENIIFTNISPMAYSSKSP